MIIRKLAGLACLAMIGGCANQAIMQSDMNNILAYGPPYTVAKLNAACEASGQTPSDKLLKAECVKLSVFAKACSLNVAQIGAGVNTALTVAASVEPVISPVLAANQVAVPAITAVQQADCTAGGFIVPVTSAAAAK